jgi:hypothetical protein
VIDARADWLFFEAIDSRTFRRAPRSERTFRRKVIDVTLKKLTEERFCENSGVTRRHLPVLPAELFCMSFPNIEGETAPEILRRRSMEFVHEEFDFRGDSRQLYPIRLRGW